LDGKTYFDDPLAEYPAPKDTKKVPSDSGDGTRIWPCYVYDASGELIRIEYPKKVDIPWIGWR